MCVLNLSLDFFCRQPKKKKSVHEVEIDNGKATSGGGEGVQKPELVRKI